MENLSQMVIAMHKHCAILVVGILGACGSTPTFEESRAQLRTHLDTCTNQYGYDRNNVEALGPYELGKNEKDWRLCAYAGVEKHMIPHTPIPSYYRRLITEDREMTAKVQQKSMTRAARKAKLDELISLIEEQERTEAEKSAQAQQERSINDIRNRVFIIRRIR